MLGQWINGFFFILFGRNRQMILNIENLTWLGITTSENPTWHASCLVLLAALDFFLRQDYMVMQLKHLKRFRYHYVTNQTLGILVSLCTKSDSTPTTVREGSFARTSNKAEHCAWTHTNQTRSLTASLHVNDIYSSPALPEENKKIEKIIPNFRFSYLCS